MSYSSHYQQSRDALSLAPLCATLSLEPRRAAAATDKGAAADPTPPRCPLGDAGVDAPRHTILRFRPRSGRGGSGQPHPPAAPAAPPAPLTDLLLIVTITITR